MGIQFIGRTENCNYISESFEDFKVFAESLPSYQLDIETNMVERNFIDNVIHTVQIGDMYGNRQWVLDVHFLNKEEKQWLITFLNNPIPQKLIHNAQFEYTNLLGLWNVVLENMYDTMLAEIILYNGLTKPKGFYGLAALTERYTGAIINKELQSSFDGSPLTNEQINYAALDVVNLGIIQREQISELKQSNQENVAALEMESIGGYGDMMVYGMEFDSEAWLRNLPGQEKRNADALEELNNLVVKKYGNLLIELGYYHPDGKILIKWSSIPQKQVIFGNILGCTHQVTAKSLQNWIALNLGNPIALLLDSYLLGDIFQLETYLLENHQQELIENSLYIPPGSVAINWNSPDQKLRILRLFLPNLPSSDAKHLSPMRIKHKAIDLLLEYSETAKKLSTYGNTFVEKYQDSDGRVRTSFRQIMVTGRVSSASPNYQNIPKGAEYRRPFVAAKGKVFVGGDFSSQELVLIAALSQDPVWLNALRQGFDLHGLCAELVYGNEWLAAAEDNCLYYTDDKKLQCKCPKHEPLRNAVKAISFGIAYGMSATGLADRLRITKPKATELLAKYFETFPRVRDCLDKFSRFGLQRLYVQTAPPYNRRRYFELNPIVARKRWDYMRGAEFIPYDLKSQYQSIEREARNLPIQGSSSDCMKTAMCLVRRWVNDNNLRDKVKLVQQVHDEQILEADEDIAELAKQALSEAMIEAGALIIPARLLKAEIKITKFWTK